MISEEEKERQVEAVGCRDCLSWHDHCKSECCKIVYLNIDPERLKEPGKYFTLRPKQPFRDRWYYSLRDVGFVRGLLRFKKSRIIVVGRKVMYVYPCKLLNGFLCGGHPDKKPELCKALTLETAKLLGQRFELTSNCLFKYKRREVKEIDKERKNPNPNERDSIRGADEISEQKE